MRCSAIFSFAIFVAGVTAAPIAERSDIECRGGGGGISLLNGIGSGNEFASPDISDSGNPVFDGNGSPTLDGNGNGNGNPIFEGNGNGNGNPQDVGNGSANPKGNGNGNGNQNDAAAALGGLLGAIAGSKQ